MEWFELEETFKGHEIHLPAMGRGIFHHVFLLFWEGLFGVFKY